MKKTILLALLFCSALFSSAQISITSDSLVYCQWDKRKDSFVRTGDFILEKMSVDIDKDLLMIKVTGENSDRSVIEKAFLLDFREMTPDRKKWMFMGLDKNCKLYTVTLDIPAKQIRFISEDSEPRPETKFNMFYYSISGIKINNEAITRHLEEKRGSNSTH